MAVALANALLTEFPDWEPDVMRTFIEAGGECSKGIADVRLLRLGVFYGFNYHVRFSYAIVARSSLEYMLPHGWLGLGCVYIPDDFFFWRKGLDDVYSPGPFWWLMRKLVKNIGHVVMIYGYDEKSFYVINGYPNWGDGYKGRVSRSVFGRYYVVKPVSSVAAKSGGEPSGGRWSRHTYV